MEEKELELKNKEEFIKNAPPKLLDPSIKRARDEAFANLRQTKLELAKVKEENINITDKLNTAENIVKELVKEKELLLKTQSEIKQSFVNNLNQLQTDIKAKTERITYLEALTKSN